MDDLISRKWLMECVDEGWIKFDTEEDTNTYIHLVRDIAPSIQSFSCGHENDTVSRQATIDALFSYLNGKKCSDDGTTVANLIKEYVIDKLPSI